MYFIYNNTASLLSFQDIGLVIPANDFFEIDTATQQSFFEGCSLDTALLSGQIVVCKTDVNNPPISENILSTYQARYVLSKDISAFEIVFDDTETQIGKDNVQDAIKHVIDTGGGEGVEEAPIDSKLYGRRNAEWLEVNVASGAEPSGLNGDIQFNTDGIFDASSDFNYDKATNMLKVSNYFTMPVGNKIGLWVI